MSQSTTAPPRGAAPRPVVDNPYVVLAVIFLVTGALGIPLIWMCRAWSPAVKVLLTLTSVAYTVLILWLFWLVMLWCWGRISASL